MQFMDLLFLTLLPTLVAGSVNLRGQQLLDNAPLQPFLIVNPQSGLVLDVAGGKCEDGTNIQLYKPNGTPSQLFFFGDDGNLINFKCDHMAIDVAGGSCDDANVQLFTINSTPAKRFVSNFGSQTAISSANCDGKVIDIAQGNLQEGTNVHLFNANGTPAQNWEIEYVTLTN
jgi:hypothetical protein